MKLEKDRDRHMFINVINELREETNHRFEIINHARLNELKMVWLKSKNRKEAKSWIRVALGW